MVGPGGGGQCELIGQAGLRKELRFGDYKGVDARVSRRGNECAHNKSKWMNGLVRLWKEFRCGEY